MASLAAAKPPASSLSIPVPKGAASGARAGWSPSFASGLDRLGETLSTTSVIGAVGVPLVVSAAFASGGCGRRYRRRLARALLRDATSASGKRWRLATCRMATSSETQVLEPTSTDVAGPDSEEHAEKVLTDAWEEALQGRTGDVFTEPAAFKEILTPFASAAGDEVIDTLRFERVSRGGEDGDLVLYVPGVDFTGLIAAPQFRNLSRQGCELWRCFVGPEDRTPFVKLVNSLEKWLRQRAENRKVVILGESFGGLLSLQVALRMGRDLKGLVLVNPATSYDKTIWPLLARALTNLPDGQPEPLGEGVSTQDFLFEMWDRARQAPYAYLGSTFLTGTVTHNAQQRRIVSKAATELVDAITSGDEDLSSSYMQTFLTYPEELARLLPPSTIRFRLRSWLRDGSEAVNSELRMSRSRKVELPPVLLITGDDSFLPSREEGRRLEKLFKPLCPRRGVKLVELEDCGHAPLDDRVDVAALMKDSPVWEKKRAKDYVTEWTFPTEEEVKEGFASVEGVAGLVSPVFLSTDPETGKRQFGLDALPDYPSNAKRPILFVGNHQQLALELGPLVREVVLEKGYAPRGLAHPVTFPESREDIFDAAAAKNPSKEEDEDPSLLNLPFELRAALRALSDSLQEENDEGGGDSGPSSSDLSLGFNFATWGAVPVNPKNIYRMMQRGEPILLYPGGTPEALAKPEDRYKLFWSEKTDFVRVAARFNALIVPFGNIGSADSFQGWGQFEGLRPFLDPPLGTRGMTEEASTALKLDGDGLMPVSESLEVPLGFPALLPQTRLATQTSPGVGDRFYISFGKPVDLKDLDHNDKESCDAMYKDIRAAVEGEIDYLLQAREEDPYRDLLRRQVYERLAAVTANPRVIKAGPRKGLQVDSYGPRAPSFPLPGDGEDHAPPPEAELAEAEHHAEEAPKVDEDKALESEEKLGAEPLEEVEGRASSEAKAPRSSGKDAATVSAS